MEATHFLYVGNDFLSGKNYTSKIPLPISIIDRVEHLAEFGVNLIALWRIKATDIPIEHRLGERLGKGCICDVETYRELANPLPITESDVESFQYTRKFLIPKQ